MLAVYRPKKDLSSFHRSFVKSSYFLKYICIFRIFRVEKLEIRRLKTRFS